MNVIAAEQGINPNMIQGWKKEFWANASQAFCESKQEKEARRKEAALKQKNENPGADATCHRPVDAGARLSSGGYFAKLDTLSPKYILFDTCDSRRAIARAKAV